ncbi:MAG: DUF3300 domain-containing protein [Proteobacteria bacterium]|nr:DUF3300 domain-containing protein [Pseudomonadota bacterium]
MRTKFVSIVSIIVTLLLVAVPAAADDAPKLSKAQLDQLLAPIALYPDDLLSNVLMASTYPLDVVDAARWRKDPDNAKLTGDSLTEALKSKSWDPSVKALVPFPDVLQNMSDKLDWMQSLGDAFVNQQSEVMDEIQFLRSKADAAGHLQSNSQQKVTKEPGSGTPPEEIYTIEPSDPDVVYVPDYEPSVVYGPWWYPDYPPYGWGYPGIVYTDGFFWGAGVAIVGGIWGWNHWDWHHRRIDINVNRWNRINGDHRRHIDRYWKHDARHRGGKHFNHADIERRLKGTDRPAFNKNASHGEQLRHHSRTFSKARSGGKRSYQKRGGDKKTFVRKRSGGHSARGVRHFRGGAVHHRGGGGRRGGGHRGHRR